VSPDDELCVSELIDGVWTYCGCEDCEQREYESRQDLQ
jgi:hypothetical protein